MDKTALIPTTMVSKLNAKRINKLPIVEDLTLERGDESADIARDDRYGIFHLFFLDLWLTFFKGLHCAFWVTEGQRPPKGFSDRKGIRDKGKREHCLVQYTVLPHHRRSSSVSNPLNQ
jgi:hypothetical protein